MIKEIVEKIEYCNDYNNQLEFLFYQYPNKSSIKETKAELIE
jgi:hypothetical protein